jgi:DNA-binding NarL/FixJ family response regulator
VSWRRRRKPNESAAEDPRAAWEASSDADERAQDPLGDSLMRVRPSPRPGFLQRLDEDMWRRFENEVSAVRPAPREPARRSIRLIQVMVGDGEEVHRAAVMKILEAHPRIEVVGEADTGDATMRLAHWLKPDVVVFDPRMLDGEVVLERLRTELPQTGALVLTADESVASEVDAIGAARYVSKRAPAGRLPDAVIELYAATSDQRAGDRVAELYDRVGADGPGPRPQLDESEVEILRRVADGLTDEAIARQLYMSERMVREHLERIREGTGLSQRSEFARWAAEVTRECAG